MGESVEEAVLEALVQLGARKDEVDVEVLATARAGVLGLGAREARVRGRARLPAEEEAPEPRATSRRAGRKATSRKPAMSSVARRSVAHRTRSHAHKAKGAADDARIRGAGVATEPETKISRGRIRRRPPTIFVSPLPALPPAGLRVSSACIPGMLRCSPRRA